MAKSTFGSVVPVQITSPTDGQQLVYDDTISAWTNGTAEGGGNIGGTIADGQVAFGTGADTIGGSADFTWGSDILQFANYTRITSTTSMSLDYGEVSGFYVDEFGPYVYAGEGAVITFDVETGGASFNVLGLFNVGAGGSTSLGATTVAGLAELTNAVSSGATKSYVFQTDVTATDLSGPDGIANMSSIIRFGLGGVAAKGTPILHNDLLIVEGTGSNDSEYNIATESLYVNIGTGFTQTTGPVGFVTFRDDRMEGPIGVQPRSFLGNGMLAQNYYNGAPDYGTSHAAYIGTYYGSSNETTHAAADTYPIDTGLRIFGYSRASGVDGVGFTTALAIGGGVTPSWSTSKIGTGIDIRDYSTAGININNAGATTAPSIIFDTFLQTSEMASAPAAPPANGVRIYAVDNGGKTELLARFASGAAQRIAIEP